MKQQWNMMKDITVRYRSLGMSSQVVRCLSLPFRDLSLSFTAVP